MTVLWSWTEDQWRSFCFLIEEGWHGDFDDNARLAWRTMLDGFTPAETSSALKMLLRNGSPHRPSIAEVVAEIDDVQNGAPNFDTVWPIIEHAIGRHLDDHDRGLEQIANRAGVLAAAWVASYGYRRLQQEPVSGDYGGATMHKLRQSFAGATIDAKARTRLLTLVPSDRAKQLHRFDPLTLLPGGAA